MVLIMVTSWFPHDKANDVGKKYVELAKKYPPTPELGETLAKSQTGLIADLLAEE